MYVIREDGKYRVAGIAPDGPEVVGEVVLELLGKNDIKGAQWWMNRVVAGVEPRSDGTGQPAVVGL